jgi:hypothetical protein
VEDDQETKEGKKPSQLETSQGTWASTNVEKSHAFDEHLANVFQLHLSEKVHFMSSS